MDAILFEKLQVGRKKYQEKRTREVKKLARELFEDGRSEIGQLTKRELFIAGVALY